MEILDFHTSLPFTKGSIITMGNFDGVHRGHLALVERLLSASEIENLPSVLVTYFPNPAIVLGKNKDLKSIYPESKKQEILSAFGMDYLLTIPFTEDFSQISAYRFTQEILVEKLNAKHIIIGYNHFFGKGREGDFLFLQKYADEFGFTVEQIAPVFVDQEKVSSSEIRKNLKEGTIEKANSFLSRPFSILGTVVKGFQRGRTISFPTANLSVPENSIVPANGVYAGFSLVDGRKYNSMVNIGFKPTFGENVLTIESHLLDFHGDIYGKQFEQFFIARIRNEKKFPSIEELIQQLEIDRTLTIQTMAQYTRRH